ncbi:conserved hypothetical protein [Ricinus communis]|uniref:Uncharacterized protein n=1 Tax=Ricinus communis TaxID=3988 RepID=B9T057_RICCO|nr:conserved hypothetical protein [Ricinus communis]
MSFDSSRRVLFSSSMMMVVAVLLIFLLQIWICSDCKAEAIRAFPDNSNSNNSNMEKLRERRRNIPADHNASKVDLFRKFFDGRVSSFNNRTEKGFEDNKRRVPSCPDPLHN